MNEILFVQLQPIWPIVNDQSGGWNKTGIFLALLAVCEYSTRDLRGTVPQNQVEVPASAEKRAKEPEDLQKAKSASSTPAMERGVGYLDHWVLSSIGLGGLIFSLHSLLADSGTLVAFAWSGYPISGPLPGFHGYIVLIAIILGIVIANSSIKHISHHPAWMFFGIVSTYVMYHWRDWPGYAGGSLLAMFLSSITPDIIKNAALHGTNSPGKVYFTAWLTVCLFDLAHIWTVAYAFVPAGWLLRERTDM